MTASMILPNKDLGQAFWKKSYKPKSTLKGQAYLKRTSLRRVSEKMRKKLVEYARVKRIWWAARLEIDGGRCQFVDLFEDRCGRKASSCPHHINGRGKNLCEPGTFLAACFFHHNWIHENPNKAREKGLLR